MIAEMLIGFAGAVLLFFFTLGHIVDLLNEMANNYLREREPE